MKIKKIIKAEMRKIRKGRKYNKKLSGRLLTPGSFIRLKRFRKRRGKNKKNMVPMVV